MSRRSTLAGLMAALLLASPLVRAAPVSITQALNAGWVGGACSPCNGAVKIASRYFASFSVQDTATFNGASFAVSESTLFGYASSFSVSIWSAPIDGTLLYEAVFDPGEYTRIGLPGIQPGRGFIDVLLSDWFLDPGEYWISLYAPGASISWGTDDRRGDDRGYIWDGGPGALSDPYPYLGFSLRGNTGPAAVPIGGTLPLLLAGLAALAFTRRRASVG